ncbi:TonB-dependent siderophore receptor [Roseovarius indicus]|uniref:TonB-dependent siderophore receptor n=3 Tax=Roseovarius indicus TaxID=540747 RepID=UPI001F22EA3B|nr:TonB-dependent siderophore receptor [Roseovarius indicus]
MRTSISVLAVAAIIGLPATAQEGQNYELGTIQLESESDDTLQQDGYVAQGGRQATKVDTEIRRIPQNISVVTTDQIEDQQPRTLLDTVGYSSGTSVNNFGFDTRYDALYLRGFPAYYTGLFRDGLRQYNGPSAWFRNDPYTYEGVALLKGPASSLYGVSGPGGLVNIVSKRPLDYKFRELKFTTGTDDRAEVAFDFSGPIDQDGRLLYRLTGLWRDSGTPLPGYPDDKMLIAPSLTYNVSDRTRITFLGEYSEATVGGTAAYYNPSYGVASELYNGDPAYNDFEQTQWRAGYEIEHELTNAITLRQNLRYSEVDADLEYSGFYAAGGGLARYWGHYLEDMQQFSVDTMAEIDFSTGAVEHEMVAGVDYTQASYDAYSAVGYVSAAATAAMPVPYSGGQRKDQVGVYFHDQMTSGPWTVFASGRYDWVDTKAYDATGRPTNTSDEAFSGRIGVAYEFSNGLTPFANYSTSFSPNVGRVFDDVTTNVSRPAEPTRAEQAEIGVKYVIPGTDSLITASLFDIQQEDGVVFDTSTGVNKQRQLDLHSQGFEIEAQANLTKALRVTGSFTKVEVEIEKGAAGTNGNDLSAIPETSASLWAFYEPTTGPLRGIGIGGGLRYVGPSWGDDQNSFRNSERYFTDLSFTYDLARHGIEGVQLQANVKNLFDEDGQTCSAGTCYRYEGRTATVSLRHRF